jgi:hypothetical protein
MRLLRSPLTFVVVLSVAQGGCAGVRVYSDPGFTHETGVKVFAPKPYLLVSHTGAKNNPVQLSIVYLPDTRDVSYIRQKRGWGSNDLGLAVQNGMLVQLGSKGDARMAEGTSAIASLLTAAAKVYAAERPPGAEDTVEPDAAVFELYEIRQDEGRTVLVRVTTSVQEGPARRSPPVKEDKTLLPDGRSVPRRNRNR